MSIRLKSRLIGIFLFLITALATVILYFHIGSKQDNFSLFTQQIFTQQMLSDTLSMHYTIANPKDYGISSYTVSLPLFDKNAYLTQGVSLENSLHLLNDMDISSLSECDILDYQLLKANFENQLSGQNYYYYYEPLSVNSGIQSQLPILLAEYYFSSEQDVKDYLELLAAVPTYYNSIIHYEESRAKAGLFMSTYSADKLIEQCSTIINDASIEDNSHFLISSFQERIDSLTADSLLSPAKAKKYLDENKHLLKEKVIPAYSALSSSIGSLKQFSKNEYGLCYFPKGRSYYIYLLKHTTGSSKDIQTIKNLLQEQLRNDYSAILSLSKELQSQSFTNDSVRFPLSTPEDMLADLEQRIQTDYPPYPSLGEGSKTPVYMIKRVSPALQNYVSPAFYLTPPIDNMQNNSIYINPKNDMNGLELYTTLAHEGYPGHFYQTVYFQTYAQTLQSNPIRSLLYYGGYTEGWALYVENESYEYAKNVLSTPSAPDWQYVDRLLDLYRYDQDFQLCMYSILDIAIHYDGMKYEEVHSMLAEFGITDDTTTRNIYEYIVEEPTNYLKYYLGYLEFLELKKEVQTQLQGSYTDRLFHQFVLESGPMDFSLLKKCVLDKCNAYLAQKNVSSQLLSAAYIFLKKSLKFVNAFSKTVFSSSLNSFMTACIILSWNFL